MALAIPRSARDKERMEKQEPRKPNPNFYKVLALVFLALGIVLIWQALRRNEWLYWAFGIMTILNAIMSALKGLVPGETKH